MDKKDHKPLHGARKNKKSPKKPCHKRIFQKSGDIFFGATSHEYIPKSLRFRGISFTFATKKLEK